MSLSTTKKRVDFNHRVLRILECFQGFFTSECGLLCSGYIVVDLTDLQSCREAWSWWNKNVWSMWQASTVQVYFNYNCLPAAWMGNIVYSPCTPYAVQWLIPSRLGAMTIQACNPVIVQDTEILKAHQESPVARKRLFLIKDHIIKCIILNCQMKGPVQIPSVV